MGGIIGALIVKGLVKEPAAYALQKALEYITSDFEQNADIVHERMARVNALVAKVHELSVASGLPEAEGPACEQKITKQIGANSEMLARLEERDFSDVEKLFGQFCKPPNDQK